MAKARGQRRVNLRGRLAGSNKANRNNRAREVGTRTRTSRERLIQQIISGRNNNRVRLAGMRNNSKAHLAGVCKISNNRQPMPGVNHNQEPMAGERERNSPHSSPPPMPGANQQLISGVIKEAHKSHRLPAPGVHLAHRLRGAIRLAARDGMRLCRRKHNLPPRPTNGDNRNRNNQGPHHGAVPAVLLHNRLPPHLAGTAQHLRGHNPLHLSSPYSQRHPRNSLSSGTSQPLHSHNNQAMSGACKEYKAYKAYKAYKVKGSKVSSLHQQRMVRIMLLLLSGVSLHQQHSNLHQRNKDGGNRPRAAMPVLVHPRGNSPAQPASPTRAHSAPRREYSRVTRQCCAPIPGHRVRSAWCALKRAKNQAKSTRYAKIH